MSGSLREPVSGPKTRSVSKQWIRRLLSASGAFVLGAMLVPVGSASAHAIVDDIVPADGSVLTEPPDSIVVTFSEPMRPEDLVVDVKASGDQLAPSATAMIDPSDARRVVITMPEVGDGAYQVRLQARDGEDLHQVVARTSFALGEAAPAPSRPISESVEPFESSARWIVASGFGLLVGVVAVRRRLATTFHEIVGRRLFESRLHSLAVVGAVLVLVGRAGILVARAVSLGGTDIMSSIGTVLATSDGRRSIAVVISVVGVLLLEHRTAMVWLDIRLRPAGTVTFRQMVVASALTEVAIVASWGAHSELVGTVSPVVLAAKSAHLVGLGLWVGVLVVVLVAGRGRVDTNALLVRMSRVALTGAVVATVSGVVLASRLIVSLTALLSSPYGLMLATKLFVIALVLLLGLGTRRSVGRGVAGDTNRAGVRVGTSSSGSMVWPIREALCLVIVMVFGASMATSTPAVDPSFLPADGSGPEWSTAIEADDLLVNLRAIPNRPGTNALEIRIGETRRPSPGPVTGVDVTIGVDTYTASRLASGVAFIDDVELPAGESTFEFVAHREGLADSVAVLVAHAQVQRYVEPTRISSTPMRTSLTVFALLITVVSAALLLSSTRTPMLRRRVRPSRTLSIPTRRVG